MIQFKFIFAVFYPVVNWECFFFGNAGGTKFASCFICNERGHLSKNCPKNTHGIYPKVYLHLTINVEDFLEYRVGILGIILLKHKYFPFPVFEPCWWLLNLHFSQLLPDLNIHSYGFSTGRLL